MSDVCDLEDMYKELEERLIASLNEAADLRDRVAELESQLIAGVRHGVPDEDGVTVQALTVQRQADGLSRLWAVEVPVAMWKKQGFALTSADVHEITLGRGEQMLLAMLGIGGRDQ